MADDFSTIAVPARDVSCEDGTLIQSSTKTRSTEAEALRAVETPNWYDKWIARDIANQRETINHSKELYCYGCGVFHDDAAFGYDSYEKERRLRNRHCKAWRGWTRLYHTGREDLLADDIRRRIIKTSRKERYGRG